jgi:hypothetical protein
MLRSELPFKISVVSIPNILAGDLFSSYTEQVTHKSNMGQTTISYTKKMSVDTFPIELHIRMIPYEEQDTRQRLRAYQGSVGMIYIHEKGDLASFKKIISDYLLFRDVYESTNSNLIFLGIENQSKQGSMIKIIKYVKEYQLNYKELSTHEIQSFDQFIRSFILNSQAFQATTQGSCDINIQ